MATTGTGRVSASCAVIGRWMPRKWQLVASFVATSRGLQHFVGGIASRFGEHCSTSRELPCEHSLDPDRFRSRSTQPGMAPARAPLIAGTIEEHTPTTQQPRNKHAPNAHHAAAAANRRHPKPQAWGLVSCYRLPPAFAKMASPATGQAPDSGRTNVGQGPNKHRTDAERTPNKSGKMVRRVRLHS